VKFRIGIGFDIHRLETGRPLKLGGVHIPFERGLVGHSDGDVLLHAITDAVLGAAGLGNIGELYPDTDPAHRGIDSREMLAEAVRQIGEAGFAIGNIDSNVLAERPRLAGYVPEMKRSIADVLGSSSDRVHVKAKTMEKLDAVGTGRAIAAEAIVLIYETS
jgi:2-C-methyl-D-erythritol 2,4-cyclodiphosphate synthase